MSKPKVTWVVLDSRTGTVRCERCGREHPIRTLLPLRLEAFLALVEGYEKEHRGCLPGMARQPAAPQEPEPSDG